MIDTLPPADVYNLHWIAGFLDYQAFFGRLGNSIPIVWTLHDMNPFTGGCHYTAGCGKFTTQCDACPALGSNDPKDLASRVFSRKMKAYTHMAPAMVRIVTPSIWLGTEARKSTLFGRFAVTTIPNGLDTDNFQPRNKACAREAFGLPEDASVIMFTAQSLANHRKGMDCLGAALQEVRIPGEIYLLAAGAGRLPKGLPHPCVTTGELTSERLLSFAYSAADVLVCPSREDNLPNVVLEAMACGTPVIGFHIGGIPDMVRPGKTGLLAVPEDVRSLREAIETVLKDASLRASMSRECRHVAEKEYALELQADRYLRLYEELAEMVRPHQRSATAQKSAAALGE